MRELAFALAVLALAPSCRQETAPTPAPASSRERTDLAPVVASSIAKLEAQLAPAPQPPVDTELAEQIDGLLETLAGADERLKRIARDELRSLDAASVPALRARLFDSEASQSVRIAAAAALGELDHPASARALLERLDAGRLKKDEAPWLRAHCAWKLASLSQDWVVPGLLLCLRYETDNETVIYIARALARFGVYSGLDALYVVSRDDPREEMRNGALTALAELAQGAGFGDASELYQAWKRGDEALADAPFSPARELEVWRILKLFGEWQLRPVDDGRFVLSLEHHKVTPLLVAALDDENRYVRVHAAQCVERLAGRARPAGPRLLELIDEPQISDQVILALGALRHEPAEAALIERTGPAWPLEVRMSATQALGAMGLASSAPALRKRLDEKLTRDLRVASLAALVRCAPETLPLDEVRELRSAMTGGEVDSAAPELALDAWLEHRASADTKAVEALKQWRSITTTDSRTRVNERAAVLDMVLGA